MVELIANLFYYTVWNKTGLDGVFLWTAEPCYNPTLDAWNLKKCGIYCRGCQNTCRVTSNILKLECGVVFTWLCSYMCMHGHACLLLMQFRAC